MDVKDIEEIVKNAKDQPNKKLIDSLDLLLDEFNKTKELIVDLTRHLDSVEASYKIINKEINKRISE